MLIATLFKLGARAILDMPAKRIFSRNGVARQVAKGAVVDQFYHYDHRTQKFELATSPFVPRDGAFQTNRVNTWNNGGADDRGFLSVEAGGEITKANPAAPVGHIRGADTPSGNAFTIQNTGATVKRGCGQNAGQSATLSMFISCWVKKVGGGALTSADVHVHMGTASGDWVDANNRCGTTRFERFRDDWYRISATAPTIGVTTTVAQGIKVAIGTTLYVEFGQHERYSTSTPGATDPIPTDVAANTDRERAQVVLEAFLHGGTTAAKHPKCGAMAICFIPERLQVEQTFGSLLQWGSTTDKHELALSADNDTISYVATIGSSAEASILCTEMGVWAEKQAIGVVAFWGGKGGLTEYFAAANGVSGGVITAADAHPALDPARVNVGGRLDGSDVASNAANARIMYAVLFDRKLTQQEACQVSKLLELRAKEYYLWVV